MVQGRRGRPLEAQGACRRVAAFVGAVWFALGVSTLATGCGGTVEDDQGSDSGNAARGGGGSPDHEGTAASTEAGAESAEAALLVPLSNEDLQAIEDMACAGWQVDGQPTDSPAEPHLSCLIPCEFDIPPPPAGETIDLNAINLVYSGGENGPVLILESDANPCTSGWRLIDRGARTEICPETCEQLSEPPCGTLTMMFGCYHGPVPPP